MCGVSTQASLANTGGSVHIGAARAVRGWEGAHSCAGEDVGSGPVVARSRGGWPGPTVTVTTCVHI